MTRAGELRPEFTGDGEGIGIGIGMIWAEARGADDRGAIGRDGGMPWHLPEDLAHFKSTTWGAPVIMGRRTWESLPERFRPLPGRENIVVTRDAGYAAEGATAVTSLDEAVARTVGVVRGEYEAHLQRLAEDSGASCQDPGAWPARAAWIIGGGRLYRAAMPIADELVVTKIELDVPDADTFAPEIGPEWELVDPGSRSVSKTGLAYRFERWVRR